VVARDGIEPPTPAFSGLDSSAPISLIRFALLPPNSSQTACFLEQ
jgi:hypothetical protein